MATEELGARERQIMDILFRLGRATVADVLAELPDPPTYSAVRGMLRLLEDKGLALHERDGLKYVYAPAVAKERARKSALQHLVRTFFDGSPEAAAAALLGLDEAPPDQRELERLRKLVARKTGKEGK